MDRLGPYVLIDTLGKGGMGTVYRAKHAESEVTRAVKVLGQTSWNDTRRERFGREVINLTRISHPGVVRIHDAGVEDGHPWFAMDLVEGQPLSEALAAERLDLDRALSVAVELARGVAALHGAGIVHRDLKPDNVMLTPEDRAVVLDLGLAMAPEQDERLTRTGSLLGTLGYMSPEQLRGSNTAQPQTDVYALGLILFELTTGASSVPRAESEHELIGKLLNQPRSRPTAADMDLPLSLDAVFDRATDPEIERRYPDAGALAEAIEALRARHGPSRRGRTRRRMIGAALALTALFSATLIAQITGSKARTGADAPKPPIGAVAAKGTPRALTLTETRIAEQRLAKLRGTRTPREQARLAETWLSRYAAHPEAWAVRALLATARRTFPLRELVHPGDARGWFLSNEFAVTLGSDESLRIWDLTRGEETNRVEVEARPHAVGLLPDGQSFLAQSAEHVLTRYDLSGKTLSSIPHPWETPLCFAFDAKGRVAVGGVSQWAHLLKLEDGAEQRSFGMHLTPIFALAMARKGERLVTVTSVNESTEHPLDNQVRIYDVTTGQTAGIVPLLEHPTAMACSPDDRRVVVGDGRGRLFEIDLRSYTVGDDLGGRPAHKGPVTGLSFAPDGEILYSVGGQRSKSELLLWTLEEERIVRRVQLEHTPLDLATSPDGRHLLIGTTAGRVELWASGLDVSPQVR